MFKYAVGLIFCFMFLSAIFGAFRDLNDSRIALKELNQQAQELLTKLDSILDEAKQKGKE